MTERTKFVLKLEDLLHPQAELSPVEAEAAQGGFTVDEHDVRVGGGVEFTPGLTGDSGGQFESLKAIGDMNERMRSTPAPGTDDASRHWATRRRVGAPDFTPDG